MNQTLNMSQIPEKDRLAFYGALFATAAADSTIDRDEVNVIFELMELEGMSEAGRRKAQSYMVEPPQLYPCLHELASADEALRFGLMVNLVDVARVDGMIDPNERKAIQLAQGELRITDAQVAAIEEFIRKVNQIRERGLDDNHAADALKNATSSLTAVGVPIAAVYFSGSVIGLSAAGITSGLAALGLGLGMVPGIGIAILLGAGIFYGVSKLLDTGDARKKEQVRAEKERKAQLVIKNLQASINALIERIQHLEKAAADAETNREAVLQLNQRLRALQQLLAKRRSGTAAA